MRGADGRYPGRQRATGSARQPLTATFAHRQATITPSNNTHQNTHLGPRVGYTAGQSGLRGGQHPMVWPWVERES